MKRVFTTNLLILLFLNILIKPFWIFGIDRTVQNTVGAGEYGIFYTLFNFSLLLNILLDFGITNYNNREISRHPQMINRYLSNVMGIKVVLGLIYAIFTLLLAFVLGYSNWQVYLLVALIFNQFLSSFILYLRSNLSGLQLFKLDSLLSVLDKAVMIIICSILLWSNIIQIHFTIDFFVLAQLASYIITAAVVLTIVIKRAGTITFRIDIPFLITMLKRSFPYALLILLMTIYSRIDSVVIERILPNGNVASGIYAQAFRLLDAANMFPFLFASLLLPMFSKMIKEKAALNPFVSFATILLLVPVVSFAVPTFIFRNHIMDLLYNEHTLVSSEVLGVLMGSFVFIALGYVFGTLLTAQGELKKLNLISFIAVIVSICLQLVLVERFKIMGAAYGNLITNGLVTVLTVWIAIDFFKFKVRQLPLLKVLAFLISSVLITVTLFYTNKYSSVSYLMSILLIVISAFLYKLIRLKEIVPFFSKDASFD